MAARAGNESFHNHVQGSYSGPLVLIFAPMSQFHVFLACLGFSGFNQEKALVNLRDCKIFVSSSNGCYAGAPHEMRYVLVTDDRAQGNDWRQLPGDQWQWSHVMWGAGGLMTVSLIADHTLTLLYSYTLII